MNSRKDLLICIAFHYTENTFSYVCKVIDNILSTYTCSHHIVVHTNTQESSDLLTSKFKNIEVIVKQNKGVYLTWEHRQYMLDHIEEYDTFMYVEDDIFISYPQLDRYLANFKLLYPNYIPALFRYEELGDKKYGLESNARPDGIWHGTRHGGWIEQEGKYFIKWREPYSGFWILPANILKQKLAKIGEDFINNVDLSSQEYVTGTGKPKHKLVRENASSFTYWSEPREPVRIVVEVEGAPQQDSVLAIPTSTWIHHLSNKYVNTDTRGPRMRSAETHKLIYK